MLGMKQLSLEEKALAQRSQNVCPRCKTGLLSTRNSDRDSTMRARAADEGGVEKTSCDNCPYVRTYAT